MEPHEQITIAEYQLTAEDYRIGTWNHDVSQNRNALIAAMNKSNGKILDLGCGSGRDLVAFQEMGYQVTGLDATPAFVEMASQIAGCDVWQQSFLSLDLLNSTFDGIFANASLIHVPSVEMLGVLKHLNYALSDCGVLLMSMVRGDREGYSERPTGYRYVTGWEYETLEPILVAAKFQILHHYYRPQGVPTEECSWLVMVARKIS
jgi:2-polyprenyl-3-methyl-5-hydroxy-6-metoxy-1,4-benzoquinol methylase